MAAARLHTEPMSRVDADFYHIDLRTNMMMITGVLMFDEPVDFERLLCLGNAAAGPAQRGAG